MKMTFMIEQENYQYNVMYFEGKNFGTTYQIMMEKVFQEEIGKTLEVYNKYMIVKYGNEHFHA